MNLPLAIGLILANGFFVAMEFALLASLRTRVEELPGRIRRDSALRSMGRIGTVLAGTQLGVTLASLALGSVAEPALDRLFVSTFHTFHLPASVSHTLAIVSALAIVVFAHLVMGEMVPKSIALTRPERTLMALTLPASAFVWLFTPVIWVLNRLARLGARAFGVEPADELRSSATPAELGHMLAESRGEGLLEDDDHERLLAALGFLDRACTEVMVPRDGIVAIAAATTVAEAESVIRDTGHSRLLVTGQDLDDVLGFVHAKDLLQVAPAVRDLPIPLQLARPILMVPPDRGLGDVLSAMQRARRHLALVADVDRRTLGMVTMENLLETIVGDIVDESDRDG